MRELNEEPAPGEGAGLEGSEPAVQAKPDHSSVYDQTASAATILGVKAVFTVNRRATMTPDRRAILTPSS
jgi:hypothetical protein